MLDSIIIPTRKKTSVEMGIGCEMKQNRFLLVLQETSYLSRTLQKISLQCCFLLANQENYFEKCMHLRKVVNIYGHGVGENCSHKKACIWDYGKKKTDIIKFVTAGSKNFLRKRQTNINFSVSYFFLEYDFPLLSQNLLLMRYSTSILLVEFWGIKREEL